MNLTDRSLDFPRRTAPPSHIYMIACTQRTGSTLLALSLWRRNTLGAPMSYFNPWTMESYRKGYGFKTDDDYINFIQSSRTSPNGVFGYKIGASHWLGLNQHMPHLYGRVATRDVIYLRRRNQVAQAISLFKARKTGEYFPEDPNRLPSVDYNYEQIDAVLTHIRKEHQAWSDIFEVLAAQPIEVWYEDILPQAESIATRLCERLGLSSEPAPGVARALPTLERQANATSADWEDRFRRDRAQRQILEPELEVL